MDLLSLDKDTFMAVQVAWGFVAVMSGFSLYKTGQLPMSTRLDTNLLDFLGTVDKKTGWILMESPILAVLYYVYRRGEYAANLGNVMVFAPFFVHYVHRAMIFPHRMRNKGKRMMVTTIIMSFCFYVVNGYFIGYYFGSLRAYDKDWVQDPRYLAGMFLFLVGATINIRSDSILIGLRAPGETGYKIPKGGMFKYVTCPHYFGEIVEWLGFAVLSWSVTGVVYFLWIVFPLIAQSLTVHAWYLDKFREEYPLLNRKAIFPFIL